MASFGFANEELFMSGQGLIGADRAQTAKRRADKMRRAARKAVAQKARTNPDKGFALPVYGKNRISGNL